MAEEDILTQVKEIVVSHGIEESVATEIAQKCGEISAWRPYAGATSFSEIDQTKVAQEFAGKIEEQSYMLRSIVDNITSKEDMNASQKVASIKDAASEFETRMANLELEGSKSFWGKIKTLFRKEASEEIAQELPSVGGFKIYKDSKGQFRWLSLSSNAFQDKDLELFTTKALEEAIEYADKEDDRGPLLVYHIPSAEIGQCDYQALAGRFLVESGIFDDTPLGRKAVEYFVKAEEEFQVSIGFQYQVGDEEDGVYDWLRIIERSVTPEGAAANPWTSFKVLGEKDMNEKKLTMLKDIFGDDLASKVVSEAEEKTKELEATISFKETKEVDTKEDDDFGDITDVKEEKTVRPSVNHPHGKVSHTHLVTPGYKHAHDDGPEFTAEAESEEQDTKETSPLVKLATLITDISEKMDNMEEKIKVLSLSEDEKVSNILRPMFTPQVSKRPSEDDSNSISEEKAKELLGAIEDLPVNPAQVYVEDLLRGRGQVAAN